MEFQKCSLVKFFKQLILQMLSATSNGRTIPMTANVRDSQGVILAYSSWEGTGQGNLQLEVKQDDLYQFTFAT